MLDVLMSMKWYCIVVLIFTSLMANGVEYLFICLFAIYVYSLVKSCVRLKGIYFTQYFNTWLYVISVSYFASTFSLVLSVFILYYMPSNKPLNIHEVSLGSWMREKKL